MDDKNKEVAIEGNQTIASGNKVEVEDLMAKNEALEAESARLLEERENYKIAYLKEKKKQSDTQIQDESEDDKIRRIAKETLIESRILEINREREENLKRALKENKELKLAQLNKTDIAVTTGTHSESQVVKDTMITPEQMELLRKQRNWDDKTIERYKKNLLRYGGNG